MNILFIISQLLFFSFSIVCENGYAYSDRELESFKRSISLDKQLNCVSQYLDQNEIKWEEVCYTQSSEKASARSKKVTDTLDEMEKAGIFNQQILPESVPDPEYSMPWIHKEQTSDYNAEILKEFQPATEKLVAFGFKIYAGRREDDLKWSISGLPDGTSPDILSELTWSDLQMVQIKGRAQAVLHNYFVIDILGKYAEIYQGDNQDSDYSSDHRTLEVSRSNNRTNEKNAMDFSGAIGYRFNFSNEDAQILTEGSRLTMTSLAGYSYHAQRLKMTDGMQTIPASGSFQGLNSTYLPEWDGPWLGLELAGEKNKFAGLFRFEYHFVNYYAKADWNLRSDFQHPQSYEHIAENGHGLTFEVEGSYRLTDRWRLNANLDIQNWKMEKGLDRVFFSNGTIATTQLNEVEWKSYALMLGASYQFP